MVKLSTDKLEFPVLVAVMWAARKAEGPTVQFAVIEPWVNVMFHGTSTTVTNAG